MNKYKQLNNHLKIEWSKEYLTPGLIRLNPNRKFSDKEYIKFFDWAQENKYDLITKNASK